MFNTGFKNLDASIRIAPGDLIVIGSRPGMGKSSLLRTIVCNAAKEKSVCIIDSHATEVEYMLLLAFSQASVPISKMPKRIRGDLPIGAALQFAQKSFAEDRHGSFAAGITGMEYQRIISVLNEWNERNIKFIKARTTWDIESFLETAEKEDSPKDSFPEVLFLDYIQAFGVFEKNPHHAISKLLTRLKSLAIKYGSVVFVTSNLSREVDKITGHKPRLAHLSDSSSLEEIADKVIFILRREYYDANDKPCRADLFIEKDRTGPSCVVSLDFDKECMLFSDHEAIYLNHL